MVEALTAVGALIAALFPLLRWHAALRERHKKQQREERRRQYLMEFRAGVSATSKVYRALQDLVEQTGALRALVLRTEDHGGKPSPGVPLYSTVAHEVPRTGQPHVSDVWARVKLDAAYNAQVDRLLETQHIYVVTEDLPKGSQLRTVYENFGVLEADIFAIGVSNRVFAYASVNYDEQALRLTDKNQRTIAVMACASRMRELFRVYGDWLVMETQQPSEVQLAGGKPA